MKIFILLLCVFCFTIACKRQNFDSINQAPMKSTLIVANPMSIFNRVNSTSKVNVNAFVSITGVNANNQTAQTYFTKTQTFTADSFGTPAFLRITDVNLPSQGPYLVQVMLESNNCTVFPALPTNCSSTVGARPKYMVSQSLAVGTVTPPGYQLTMSNTVVLPSICCN